MVLFIKNPHFGDLVFFISNNSDICNIPKTIIFVNSIDDIIISPQYIYLKPF